MPSRTVQLVSLEMLGPRVQLIAARIVAAKAPWCPLAACALVRTRSGGSGGAILGLRSVLLGFHEVWLRLIVIVLLLCRTRVAFFGWELGQWEGGK